MSGLTDGPDGPDPRTGATDTRPVLLNRLKSHPAPRFLVVGGLTFAVDITALKIGHDLLGLKLPLATGAAFALAFAVNFGLSRQWVFASTQDALVHRQLVRFVLLALANLVSTLLIVVGLVHLGVYYLIAKIIAVAVNACANFVLYRHWVFA
jgi:putative flippase GtrA